MSLFAKLTIKPLLYVIGALLVVAAGLSIALYVQGARVDTATAATRVAEAQLGQRTTEREAYSRRVDDLVAANTAYGTAVQQLQAELALAQQQAVDIREQSNQAQAIAARETAAAEKALHEFATRYQVQSRVADCARAMQQVEAVCPNFDGY